MGSLLVAGFMVGILGMFVASGIRNTRRRKQPPTRIADCRDGQQVKIVGKLVAINTVKSPASGFDCAGYVVIATLGRRIVTKQYVTSFLVQDGSGEAIVVPDGDHVLELDLDTIASKSALLDMYTVADVPGLAELGMTKAEKLTEGLLQPGRRVAVFGEVQVLSTPGTSPTSGYRDGSVRKILLAHPKSGWFAVSDKPGIIGEA